MTSTVVTLDSRLSQSKAVSGATRMVAEELFAVTDELAAKPKLRRLLSGSTLTTEQRVNLVRELFGKQLSTQTVDILVAAVELDWDSPLDFARALESQGLDIILDVAENTELVLEQLFAFGRYTNRNQDLRSTLSDEAIPIADRRQLVEEALSGCLPTTILLAQRAVGRANNYEHAVGMYIEEVALKRGRKVARVTVAQPLSPSQRDRLETALSKIYSSEIDLVIDIDASVLGGARIDVGYEAIDATISGRLDGLRRTLNEEK